MAQITYADKTALYQNADVAAENKVRDVDMNEIKQVVNDNETKILLDVTDTAPAECSTGDMYFDTTDNLIYTATATDTWSSTGVAPTENTIYVVIDTQTSYIYNGVTLVSVGGGGGGGIAVYPDEPEEDTKIYIEEEDLDGQYLPVEEDVYSTNETKTNKVWIDGKPIYRKVYAVEHLANTGRVNITIGVSYEQIIKIDGYFTNGTNVLPCNFPSETAISYMIKTFLDSTNINIDTGSDRSSYYGYVWIEYTKTS